MSKVKSNISESNPYWIHKHRYNELKYFCLQYENWRFFYSRLLEATHRGVSGYISTNKYQSEPTALQASKLLFFSERIEMVEKASKLSDEKIGPYILKAVTRGMSYDTLNASNYIPCSRSEYYNLYRKFFWILDKIRN